MSEGDNTYQGWGQRFCEGDSDENSPPLFSKFNLPVIRPYSIPPSWDTFWVENPELLNYLPFAYWEDTQIGNLDCCSECEAWNQCLHTIPLKMDLQGFQIGDWLDSLLMDATGEGRGGSALFGDDADSVAGIAFRGIFLAVPWFRLIESFDNPVITRKNAECLQGDSTDPSLSCQCGTHYGVHYRTINTPYATFPDTDIYVDAKATCEEGTGDNLGQPVIIFRVYLWLVQDLCGTSSEYSEICCELLRSDEIPVDGLELDDLVNIPLYPRTYEQYLDDFDLWTATIEDPSYPPDCVGPCFDFGESDTDDPYTDWCNRGQYGGNGCPPYFCDAMARRFCEYQHLEECTGENEHYWSLIDPYCREGTRPIIPEGDIGDGSYGNTISVLSFRCDKILNCDYCPPIAGQPVKRVEIDFDISPAYGCNKTFTAIIPDCIEVEEENIFWSFGEVGLEVEHALVNKDADGVTSEDVTLLVIDTRGCVYVATQTVTCECPCPGVSGGAGLTITATDDLCMFDFNFEGQIFGPEECRDGGFVELCIVDETASYDCDDCTDPCPGCYFLGHGESTTVRWDFVAQGPLCYAVRVWDGACGCPTSWSYSTSWSAPGAPCFVDPGDCP